MQISKENNADYDPGHGVFYIAGNYMSGNETVTANNWAGGVDLDVGVSISQAQCTTPFPSEELDTEHTAEQAYEQVLTKAGVSHKRDVVDKRVVQEVRTGTTVYEGSKTGYPGIIDSQEDVGGWPVLTQRTPLVDTDGDGMPDEWEVANGLDPNSANANGRDLSTVYDNIEVYFNSLVTELY